MLFRAYGFLNTPLLTTFKSLDLIVLEEKKYFPGLRFKLL